MTSPREYLPIKDYALIGDCGSAALVSRYGSIDFLCWPRFDSPSIFAAILDKNIGGRFEICPTNQFETSRRYIGDTAVLETTFTAESGTVKLVDFMPVALQTEYDDWVWPDHEIIRILTCEAGEMELNVLLEPRPDYARHVPRIRKRGDLGYHFAHKNQAFYLRADFPIEIDEDAALLKATVRLHAGDSVAIALVTEWEEPAVLPSVGRLARLKLERTLQYWSDWSSRCQYEGPYRDAVMRSALTLKLMTFARSGAVVAAPTTSLPEHIGGERNWDYRFCWLRDASFTLRALFELGYPEEGKAFFSWLNYAVGGKQSDLNVLYTVYGNNNIGECELPHLEGYKGSRPVRVGNAASQQLQLDVYGEVANAAYTFLLEDGELTWSQQRLLRHLGDLTCERWKEPDEGIWEIRSEPRHHTYSKVMCWVALDRLIRMQEKEQLSGIPVAHYREVMAEIREVIEAEGYNQDLRSYVGVLGGDEVDASLLLLPLYGYCEYDSERMRNTFQRITERLGRGNLLLRYPPNTDDGLPAGEGAFGLCSFWDDQYLAKVGDIEGAKAELEGMLEYANDLGLFSEEIDPRTGELLGNFPQAFTHVGLINAALSISEAMGLRTPSGFDEVAQEPKPEASSAQEAPSSL